MVELVNAVASGDLGVELDLGELQSDIDWGYKSYHPEVHSGLQLRSDSDSPLLTIYRSGKYVIMGAKSHESISEIFAELKEELNRLEIDLEDGDAEPTIRNLIFRSDLEQEFDLSELSILLELEKIEYEPEQSPFLYYWPNSMGCVISIAANGIVVVSGVRSRQEAERALGVLENKIQST